MPDYGYSRWATAHFHRFWLDGVEIEGAGQVGFPLSNEAAGSRTNAGTMIHQARYLGGDAPINLSPARYEIGFSIDIEEFRFMLLEFQMKCSHGPREVFIGAWHSDIWHVPSAPSAQTEWKLSRSTPYDLVARDGVGDYTPRAFDGSTELALAASDPPGAGEFWVPDGSSVDVLKTSAASGLTGPFLTFRYPMKILASRIDADNRIPELNSWEFSMGFEEHLPDRDYAFSVT